MVFLGALMRGFGDEMVRNGIATLTGHLQVHRKGYRSDPVIQNSITTPGEIAKTLSKDLPAGSRWTPRVRVPAVAVNARYSAGITLVGIAPQREAGVSFIGGALAQGQYLRSEDMVGILVGEALAEKLETAVGRKLVLMSEDARGQIGSRAFRVRGIYRAEMEGTETAFAFVNIRAAQEMLRLGDGISEVSILLPDERETLPVAGALRRDLDPSRYEVDTWEELLPLVTATLKLYDGFLLLWFLAVFIAMGFGIVNTGLMAVFERIREFGLLRALGVRPFGIVKGVLTESFFLLLLGIGAGNLLGFLSVLALSKKGIDLSSLAAGLQYAGISARVIYPSPHVQDLVIANAVVLVLGMVVALYPALKAARFTPVEAMRHV